MANTRRHNPERRAWKGRSYRNGGLTVQELKDRAVATTEKEVGAHKERYVAKNCYKVKE